MSRYNSFFLFISVFLICSSCAPEPKSLLIDNPSDQLIELQFDQTDLITLEPNTYMEINLVHKNENIVINGKSYSLDLDNNYDYLLNPTLHNYYIEKVPYFYSSSGEKKFRNDYGDPKSEIGQYQVPGLFDKIDSTLLIKKNWTIGLGESTSAQVGIKTRTPQGYYLLDKLHREKDLLDTITSVITEELFKDMKFEK